MIVISSEFEYVSFRNINGQYHRLDGPAYISGNFNEWYENGKLHRLDGPAVIDGNVLYWYIEGNYYKECNYYEKLKEMGLGYDKN